MVRMKVKVTTTEDMLGTAPANPEIYQEYIASKAPDAATTADEVAAIGEEAVFDSKMTVFGRNEEGQPIVWDYQWKGLFKDACSMLRRVPKTESSKMKAFKKIIDGLIFVEERKIPVITDKPIGICERPLRAQTAQGERVALAASESIAAGATMEFTIKCLTDGDAKAVKEWLDYGVLRGFGQWRNSGMGRYTWELLEETKDEYVA